MTKAALIMSLIAISIGLAAAIMVAWDNSGSRNLALGTGTLAAATILFVLQLPFELEKSTVLDHVSTEFTIDRGVPTMGRWQDTPGMRWVAHSQASKWLSENNLAGFDNQDNRLESDFPLFSLVSFLTIQEFDWQIKKMSYKGKVLGGIGYIAQSVSNEKDCTMFTEGELRAKFAEANNVF